MFTRELPVLRGISEEKRRSLISGLSDDEQKIVGDLYQIAVNAFTLKQISDTYWTSNIRRVFESHAKQLNLLCCHSDHIREWLYDISWFEVPSSADKTENWKEARRLVMACESEWSENEDEILWDFFKLSWSNAELRIFIYTNYMKRGAAEHPADLCYRLCPLSKGTCYLLIGFPKHPQKGETFRVDSWNT